jgi:limonene-1,2-epoxide hydrolase
MSPEEIVRAWVDAFNKADAEALAALYADNAINHQVADEPIRGQENIKISFAQRFAKAKMISIPENIIEAGEWAIYEWSDPLGLLGCSVFKIENGKIAIQRGYWDKLTFLRIQGLPIPTL